MKNLRRETYLRIILAYLQCFSSKTWNHLDKAVLMRGHNIYYEKIKGILLRLSSDNPLILSSGTFSSGTYHLSTMI